MAVALALTALVGFGPTYFLRPVFRPTTTLTPLMHVHGLLFGRWTLLLVVQTTLVAARRTDLHLFVLVAIGHDWWRDRRVHPIYIWGGLVILLSGPLRIATGRTDLWRAFARMLLSSS